MKVTAALSRLPPLMELLGGIGMAAALWYGSRADCGGAADAGQFTSFIAALFMMYGPAKKLSRVNANLQQAIAASERIFEMLDTHTEVNEQPGRARRSRRSARAIEFRDVGVRLRRRRRAAFCAACRSASAPARWSPSSAAAAPARRRSSTCCRGSTT